MFGMFASRSDSAQQRRARVGAQQWVLLTTSVRQAFGATAVLTAAALAGIREGELHRPQSVPLLLAPCDVFSPSGCATRTECVADISRFPPAWFAIPDVLVALPWPIRTDLHA